MHMNAILHSSICMQTMEMGLTHVSTSLETKSQGSNWLGVRYLIGSFYANQILDYNVFAE